MESCKYRPSKRTTKTTEQIRREYQYLIIEDFQKKVALMDIEKLKAYALIHNIDLN